MGMLAQMTAAQVQTVADALGSSAPQSAMGTLLPAQQPTSQMYFRQQATAFPSVNSDLSLSQPIGVGAASSGGDSLTVNVKLGRFVSPIDVYLAYSVSADPNTIYVMRPDYTIQPHSMQEVLQAVSSGAPPAGVQPWKAGTTGMIDEVLVDHMPTAGMPAGEYSLYLMAAAPGSVRDFYLWQTTFNTAPDGAALYGQNCAGCHGPLATSTKIGATAASIQTAINANAGGMGYLRNLAPGQVQAIADLLGRQAPPPPPTTTNGTQLYAQYCASCHGPLASSSKIGATTRRIKSGITKNSGGMGRLSNLTTTQIQAIANVLAQQTPPPPPPPPTSNDGPTLYAQGCASCHGALATSTKKNRTAAQIQAAIDGNVGGMGPLANLSATQVSAIAAALGTGGTPPPPPPPPTSNDGPTLYAQGCASCHGALATSTKKNRTAAQIQAAINGNVGGMGSSALKALTPAQVQAIATALVSATPPPPPPPPTTTDGPTLYAQGCASCHGALATSTKKNRTAAQIQAAINGNVGGMGSASLRALTATQVSAIATALVSSTPIPPAPSHPTTWYRDHRSYVDQNGTVSCTSCHGADLRGGSGPSCYSCHGKKW